MSEIKDGGPAFPSTGSREYRSEWDSSAQVRTYSFGGLTKREWFAGMALQGYLASPNLEGDMKNTAEASVRMADFLLDALTAGRMEE